MSDFICRLCGGNSHLNNIYGNYFCSDCGVVFSKPDLFSLPPIKFIKLSENAKEPKQAKERDSGYDLFASEMITIDSDETKMIIIKKWYM